MNTRYGYVDEAAIRADRIRQLTSRAEYYAVSGMTCKHGHRWTPENTRIDPDGGRRCRACHRATNERSRKKRRAERKP